MAVNHRRLAAIGNYQLSSIVLGKGSFSKVELANHIILNKKVALKVMTLSQIEDPYVRKNVQREANIMSRLNHPHVVALHEVYSSKDFFCLALDFFPGGNLCDLVQDHPNGKLEEEQARIYFKQLVEGLSHIHSKGIIHRDIKLENIFLNKEKTKVVIGDFGLSNFWHPGAKLETRCGSAEYAAPEIFDKTKNYNQAVDIWSLGILLYAMLSGRLPFEVEGGDNNIKELIKIILAGLTNQNFQQLGQVSNESKLLISQLLVVDQDLRINLDDVSKHIWISKLDDDEQVPFRQFLDMQLEVAKMVQAKLKLNHLTPNQILAYVLSAKGMFGKTAGCFNLLARDLVTSSQPKMLTKIKPVMLRSPKLVKEAPEVSVSKPSTSEEEAPAVKLPAPPIPKSKPKTSPKAAKPSPAMKNLDRLLQKAPAEPHSSFWSSTPGRKAVTALTSVQNRIDQDKENIDNPDPSGRASAGKKARRESPKPGKNSWRRSVMPLPGQKRVGRLKRVDMEEDKMFSSKKEKKSVRIPLATREANRDGGSKD